MSQANDLPNGVDDVVKYLREVVKIPYIKAVWLRGSRSPTRDKEHREDSDWDITFEVDRPLIIDRPKLMGVLNADVQCVESKFIHYLHKAVEIYPTDKFNILEGKM